MQAEEKTPKSCKFIVCVGEEQNLHESFEFELPNSEETIRDFAACAVERAVEGYIYAKNRLRRESISIERVTEYSDGSTDTAAVHLRDIADFDPPPVADLTEMLVLGLSLRVIEKRKELEQLRRERADLEELARLRRENADLEVGRLVERVTQLEAQLNSDPGQSSVNAADSASERQTPIRPSRKVLHACLTVVALFTALLCLYPPWIQEFRCAPNLAYPPRSSPQYHWLFSVPGVPSWASRSPSNLVRQAVCWSSTVDASRLFAEIGALWALAAVAFGFAQVLSVPARRVVKWLAAAEAEAARVSRERKAAAAPEAVAAGANPSMSRRCGRILGRAIARIASGRVTVGLGGEDKTRKVWASWLLLGSSALDLASVIFANAQGVLPSVIGQAVWNVVIAIGLRRGGNGWRAFACLRAVLGLLLSIGLEGDYRYYSVAWCIGFLILLWGNNPTRTKRVLGGALVAAAQLAILSVSIVAVTK